MPKISVIIPTLNEEKYIRHVLEGLRRQSFRGFEIIVVDGGSTDSTREIARRYGRVILEKRRGIGLGRNTGARAAHGKLLVFLDGDTKPSKDLLKVWDKAFEGDMIAATGPILPLERSGILMEMGFRLISVAFVKLSVALGQAAVIGSNFAVRKSAFDRVGGFDERLVTYEDWDLSNRLRKVGRIAYVDDALVYTSTRRVRRMGILGYALYHMGNVIRYNLFKKPYSEYEVVR